MVGAMITLNEDQSLQEHLGNLRIECIAATEDGSFVVYFDQTTEELILCGHWVLIAGDDELAAAFRADVIGWRKQEMADLLARGVTRGDVRADVPVEIARELGQSVLWHRLLITGDAITDELVVDLVDQVLVPFVAPTTPRS